MEKLHFVYCISILMIFFGNQGCSSKAQKNELSEMNEDVKIVAIQFEKWQNGKESFFNLLAENIV